MAVPPGWRDQFGTVSYTDTARTLPPERIFMSPVRVGTDSFAYHVDERWPSFPAGGDAGEAVGVACDSRDRVYVFLRGPQPVQVFDQGGKFLTSWGEGQFVRPHG